MSENVPSDVCARQRFRSACAFHSRSLIRIFNERNLDSQRLKHSLCGQRKLTRCADLLADLSLPWMHMSDSSFSRIVTHLSGAACNSVYCVKCAA